MTGRALLSVDLRHDEGVVLSRQRARDLAELLGFDGGTGVRIATAVSELARNAHRYAGGGRVVFGLSDDELEIEVIDRGPGIADLDAVLDGRYVSSTGMGRGIMGVRRLMDGFRIDSAPEVGTRVRVTKGLPAGPPASPDVIREQLGLRAASTPYDEVTQQNQELLQALGELRARQDELVAVNRELDETNRGVVALYSELDDRAERLRDADERKSRFLADMNHELRTPLNSIVALTELLLDDAVALPEEPAVQVRFIRRMADDQLRLVGDLLDIAKIEAGRLDVDIGEVAVVELFAVLRGQLRPLVTGDAVALRFTAEPELPLLLTDEAKLIQILRNLVSNAIKFTAQGSVSVDARRVRGGVAFSVKDTGIGMSGADQDRIFDEFVQLPGAMQVHGKGTGLGLPLSRKLAEVLGGRLEVESAAGEGSTFTLRLPAVLATPIVEGQEASTLLVVDDEEAIRYVVRTYLRDSAWTTVREAASGAAALAACARVAPGAIVLDLSLPDMDGHEVLQRLRELDHLRHVPVVVHSSRELSPGLRASLGTLGAAVLNKADTSRTTMLAALDERVRAGASHGL